MLTSFFINALSLRVHDDIIIQSRALPIIEEEEYDDFLLICLNYYCLLYYNHCDDDGDGADA